MLKELDLSAYFSLPRSSARELLALGHLLMQDVPPEAGPAMERAASRLEAELEAFMSGLRVWRASESESEALAKEELDFATDGLWKIFVERLEQWEVFERRAFAKLAEAKSRTGFDYQAGVSKAERARHLQCHLLGRQGAGFTRLSYEEQAEFMTMMWTVIDQEGLEREFGELVGTDILAALRDCQERYARMVEDWDSASDPNFRLNERRDRLQRTLVLYIAAVVAWSDDTDVYSVALTRKALAPVDMLRELAERSAGGIPHEGHDELEIDSLLAQLDAIDVALGVETGDHVDHALSENSGTWSSL